MPVNSDLFKNNPFVEVIRVRDFVKIWVSQMFSQVTINLINFVIVLRVFETTHSTVAVSLVWIFYALPALFLGPFSGTIVDLTEKRKILVFTTFAEALIVLLYLFAHIKIWPIYSIVFLYSLVNQLYIPAEASTLTAVVPKRLLAVANTLFMFTIYGSFILGFGIAGSLVRIVGRNTPFLLAAFFLFLASLAVYFLPKGMQGDKGKISGLSDFWERVTEGYQFIKNRTEVLYPLTLLVVANVFIALMAVIAPLFITGIIGIDLLDIGFVIILPVGLGALIGAGGVVQGLKHLRKKWIITIGLSLLSASLLFFSLVYPNLYLPNFRIMLAMLGSFMLGIGLVSILIPSQTLLQEKTPGEFRGRVFGVLGFLFTIVSLLPILLAATIADLIGVTWVIFTLALGLGVLAVYSLREPFLKKEIYVGKD